MRSRNTNIEVVVFYLSSSFSVTLGELEKILGSSGTQILACRVEPVGLSPRLDHDRECAWRLLPEIILGIKSLFF